MQASVGQGSFVIADQVAVEQSDFEQQRAAIVMLFCEQRGVSPYYVSHVLALMGQDMSQRSIDGDSDVSDQEEEINTDRWRS